MFGDDGRDRIDAAKGADTVLGGEGGDTIDGGEGEDLIAGDAGGDDILGGGGADRLYGELLDDSLRGGPGDDLIVGGHGVDDMAGDAGDDWLRGDSNKDGYWGGPGDDTASYATATPPGPKPGLAGALVDLPHRRALDDPPQALRGVLDPAEWIDEIENVVGSPFDDELTGRGLGFVEGLGGADSCNAFLSSACNPGGSPGISASLIGGRDPGLLVNGGSGSQSSSITVSSTDAAYVVAASGQVAAGPGCAPIDPNKVSCGKPSATLGYAVLWGGPGADALTVEEGLPRTAVVILDGGEGDDRLAGSSVAEILLGLSGRDLLLAGDGDDALFSGPGGDVLEAGPGVDQLVTSTPCDGHEFRGGPGEGDIAGFAQTIEWGVQASLGGSAVAIGQESCSPTLVRGDNEILEGTQNDDVLSGNARANPLILGKQGNDLLQGFGGADNLRGEQGSDTLLGGRGADRLEAFDGERDAALHCGAGDDQAHRDPVDPPAAKCRSAKRKKKR